MFLLHPDLGIDLEVRGLLGKILEIRLIFILLDIRLFRRAGPVQILGKDLGGPRVTRVP